MLVAIAGTSLALSEWGWRNQATANFYLAPTRAWELFAGSIASFVVQKRGVQANNVLSLLGLAAIIFAIFGYNETTPFPSVYTLLPVCGVVLLVLYADKKTFAARFLSTKYFVGIGLISYSAYLWHQPLLAYLRYYQGTIDVGTNAALLAVLATFTASYFSWRYIEIPFRDKRFLTRKTVLISSGLALLILSAFGYISRQASIGSEDEVAYELSNAEFVYFGNMDERRFIAARLKGKLKKVDALLVGSSRIMQVDSSTLNRPSLNLAVSGASIEDDIAFAAEATSKLNPDIVFIGADPWLINELDGQDRWASIEDLYRYWIEKVSDNTPSYSLPYFESVSNKEEGNHIGVLSRSLYEAININKESYVAQDGAIEAVAKKAYDGSHIYNEEYVDQSPFQIVQGFDSLLNYAMSGFAYDLKAEKELNSLIMWLKNQEIEVKIVLSPYHPQLYARIARERPIYLDIENRFRMIADSNGIDIIGSYNPSIVGCTSEDFYDGMHPKERCMKKLFSGLPKLP